MDSGCNRQKLRYCSALGKLRQIECLSNPHGITSCLCITDWRNYIANAKEKEERRKTIGTWRAGFIRVARLSLAEAISSVE